MDSGSEDGGIELVIMCGQLRFLLASLIPCKCEYTARAEWCLTPYGEKQPWQCTAYIYYRFVCGKSPWIIADKTAITFEFEKHTIQADFHCWSRRYWEGWRTKAMFWWKPRKTDLRGKVGHNEGREQVPTGATFSKYHCESPSSTYFSIVALFDCWNSLPPS